MNKITICGGTASGKTTLSNKIGKILNIPVYHLDKIFWKDNQVFASQAEGIEAVSKILQEPRWIIDGSMHRSKTFDMRIAEADTIVFYDLPLWLTLWRQTKRYFKYYNKVRPDMGGNNKQKYPFTWKDMQFALNSPAADQYAKILPYKETKKVVIIKSIKDEREFINSLKTQEQMFDKT